MNGLVVEFNQIFDYLFTTQSSVDLICLLTLFDSKAAGRSEDVDGEAQKSDQTLALWRFYLMSDLESTSASRQIISLGDWVVV